MPLQTFFNVIFRTRAKLVVLKKYKQGAELPLRARGMSPRPLIVSIVACLMPEMGIGYRGKLPWRLKQEMAYFREVTSNTFEQGRRNAVIMGRKTWESIPPKFRPLPDRVNVVISRQHQEALAPASTSQDASLWLSNSLEQCIELLPQLVPNLERIYVIGGAEIYSQSVALCDALLITEISPENPALPPPMDTFLDPVTIRRMFTPDSGLRGFLPPGVALPTEPEVVEKSYRYKFALYQRQDG